jgi:hypothetical protein
VSKEKREGAPAGDEDQASSVPVWLQQLAASGGAVRELIAAQWGLLRAELRLARSAVRAALMSAILAGALFLALGVTLLGLVAVALFLWLGSWILALGILAAILFVCLMLSLIVLRRCVTWMSLPGTRAQWREIASDLTGSARAEDESP